MPMQLDVITLGILAAIVERDGHALGLPRAWFLRIGLLCGVVFVIIIGSKYFSQAGPFAVVSSSLRCSRVRPDRQRSSSSFGVDRRVLYARCSVRARSPFSEGLATAYMWFTSMCSAI